jgi:hypothetical protein
MKTELTITLLSLGLLTSAGCTKNASATFQDSKQQTTQVNPNGDLRFKVPEGWVTEQPSSSMRLGQYKLPRAEGDTEDTSLVLYYFGQGQGGSVQANIDRWVGQMQQADGSASKDKAKTEVLTVNGLKVTTVDVTGRYTAEMSPGSGSFSDKPNYRLRAAIVETPKGAYFAKLIGPEKTVGRWSQSFGEYVNSFEFK